MTIRKWVPFFLKTLLIGGLASFISSIILRWDNYQQIIQSGDWFELFGFTTLMIGMGLIFSVISQMGFFAYLTVHRFALGIFGGQRLWNWIQLFLVAFVLFDLVYYRALIGNKKQFEIGLFLLLGAVLLIVGLATAYVKSKETNQGAFIPALFFMVVVTIFEWIPGLRTQELTWTIPMYFTLIFCNCYQIIMLHRIIAKKTA